MNAIAKVTGFDITVQETTGTDENMLRVEKLHTAQIFNMDGSLVKAKFGDNHSLRHIAAYSPAAWQIFVAKDAGIEKLADLTGKRFNAGPTGGGSTKITMAIFEALGIEPDYFEGTLDDASAAYADRDIDGLSFRGTGTNPTGAITEANTSREGIFLPFSDEQIAKTHELFPYLDKVFIRANTYAGQPADIPTIGAIQGQIGVHKSVPDDVVYAFVKAYFQTLPEVAKTHTYLTQITEENSVSSAIIPLHPGAVRYYTERGIKIPDAVVPPEEK